MDEFLNLTSKFTLSYANNQKKIAVAESCTGGLLAAAITSIAGSSRYFERGFVTYTNEAKVELLGVEPKTIEQYGAVSVETAKAMAQGALEHSKADISCAITGIAGPDGGTAAKPVGTVCIAFATREGMVVAKRHLFSGNRHKIRVQSVNEALQGMLLLADNNMPSNYE